MRRRDFLLSVAATSAVLTTPARAADRFPYLETSIEALRARMDAGRLTARTLAAACLARIEAIDRKGPRLASVIEVNPDALAIAAERDRERKAGQLRGPLHGIPVLLKDNIATRDRMSTSAGSLALANVPAPRDAFVVAQLREAGAVILGKTNLSEWANFRSTRSTSGWSARGGLTRNPYALDRSASGSSSGSAAAVAASLAPVAVGHRDRWLDHVAGVEVRPRRHQADRGTGEPRRHRPDRRLAGHGRTDGAHGRGRRRAAVRAWPASIRAMRRRAKRQVRARLHALPRARRAARRAHRRGARLRVGQRPRAGRVRPGRRAAEGARRARSSIRSTLPPPAAYEDAEFEVLLHEFKAGLAAYLAEFAAVGADPQRRRPDRVQRAGARARDAALRAGTARDGRSARRPGQRGVSRGAREGVAAPRGTKASTRRSRSTSSTRWSRPTGGPAWLIDLVNGDSHSGGFTSPAAVAGYPHVTVPMGEVVGTAGRAVVRRRRLVGADAAAARLRIRAGHASPARAGVRATASTSPEVLDAVRLRSAQIEFAPAALRSRLRLTPKSLLPRRDCERDVDQALGRVQQELGVVDEPQPSRLEFHRRCSPDGPRRSWRPGQPSARRASAIHRSDGVAREADRLDLRVVDGVLGGRPQRRAWLLTLFVVRDGGLSLPSRSPRLAGGEPRRKPNCPTASRSSGKIRKTTARTASARMVTQA